jgi:hypothetical protein
MTQQTKEKYVQLFREGSFLLCRLLLTYACVAVFLASPPAVLFTREMTNRIEAVSPELPLQKKAVNEALQIFWLGEKSSTLFPTSEYQHLLDVHDLFIKIAFVVGLAVIWSILFERFMVRVWIAKIYRRLSSVLVVVTIFVFGYFPLLFDLFHQVFFPQGNYSFDPQSLIIRAFPQTFWLLNAVLLQIGVIIALRLQAHHAEAVGI